MKGFGDAKPRGGNSPRMGDLVPVIDWPEDEFLNVRIIGPVFAYAHIWFNIATKMKPAPKGTSIPKLCLDLDGATDEFVTNHCPYRKSGLGRESKFYAVNVIVRDLQENGNYKRPKGLERTKHLGHRGYWGTKADAKRTPVRVLIVSESAAQKIQNLRKMNTVKTKDGERKSYDVSDDKYGCDIAIMINSKAKGAAKIEVQKGDRSPLSEEEQNYIMFPLDLLKPARLDEAKRDMEDLATRVIKKKGDDDESPRSKNKKRAQDDDDDDVAGLSDDDLDVDDDDDDEPKKNKKKDKKSKGKSKKSRDDDDDDDDSSDDDDDIDLDADLDDDDDDDDEPKKNKKKDKGKKSKKSRDDDDDDDDDSSDDDDDDDDSSDDDDDDDSSDDDDDSEDDDDDEPRKKKKSSKKSRDDDDDDDDEPRKKKNSNKKKRR